MKNSKPSYGLRIRLHTSGSTINSEDSKLEFEFQGKTVSLRPHKNGALKVATMLILETSGFDTMEAAEEFGSVLCRGVELAGLEVGIGFDLGKDSESKTILTAGALKRRSESSGQRFLNDLHGIQVFEELGDTPEFLPVLSGMTAQHDENRVLAALGKSDKLVNNLSDNQVLAIELYNSAQFERSHRSRIVTLVSAVECIVNEEKVPGAEMELLDGFIKSAKESGTLDQESLDYLTQRLNELKKESISRACARLVRECLDTESEKAFKKWYTLRSKLVHEGKIPSNLRHLNVYDLDKLVARIIVADIERTKMSAPESAASDAMPDAAQNKS